MNRMQRLKVWKVGAMFLALFALPMFSATAHADGFSIGAIFRIGGVLFNLTFGDFGYGHPRGYYYRTHDPISYDGYRCNNYCFNSGGYHYHHESCPLVRHHLAEFDVDPYRLFDRYAPRYDRYGDRYGDRYDDRYGDGYDRYDRYDDYPYRDRYDGYDDYPYRDRRSYPYDGRYDRYRDRHHRGHSSGCPLPH